MHSILFVATLPEKNEDWGLYRHFVDEKIKALEGVAWLGENVWLVNMQQSPAALGYLIAYATDRTISYGLLPFERAPEWLPVGFDPKPISGQSG